MCQLTARCSVRCHHTETSRPHRSLSLWLGAGPSVIPERLRHDDLRDWWRKSGRACSTQSLAATDVSHLIHGAVVDDCGRRWKKTNQRADPSRAAILLPVAGADGDRAAAELLCPAADQSGILLSDPLRSPRFSCSVIGRRAGTEGCSLARERHGGSVLQARTLIPDHAASMTPACLPVPRPVRSVRPPSRS